MLNDKSAVFWCKLIAIIRCFAARGIFLLAEAPGIRGNGAARSASGLLLCPKKNHLLPVAAIILLAAMAGGCSMPPWQTGLDQILEREGINQRVRYGYRCTAGAHRGASGQHRENTLAALIAADKNSRFAFIEFDVQYSKDGRIVVYHDNRMLRLDGSLRAVGKTTFAELSEITGGQIAAYGDVIGLLTKKLNIEIKSQGDNRQDERLVDEIIADIRARKRANDVLISSISSDVAQYINRKYPDIATGQVFWLTSSTYLHIDGLTKRLYEKINASRADYLMLHAANLHNIEDLLAFKPRGKTIVFWDFGDTMYIVHKDSADRLWGDSGLQTFFNYLRFKLASALRPFAPKSQSTPQIPDPPEGR